MRTNIISFTIRGEMFRADISKLSPKILHRAALFGLETTLRNAVSASGAADHEARTLAISKRLDILRKGEWREPTP